jgi:hypothetical protein
VISTAGDAALTVSDPGHLMNGTFALPSPPRSLETAPVQAALENSTTIGSTDALRTGAYTRR